MLLTIFLAIVFSFLLIAGVGVISIWDGFRSDFTFLGFFLRFYSIFAIYKMCHCCDHETILTIGNDLIS